MSIQSSIHLFIQLVLQNRMCEIVCPYDADLLQVMSHLTLMRQFNDCDFDLAEPIVCLFDTGDVLDLTKTIRQLNLKDGMLLHMYL